MSAEFNESVKWANDTLYARDIHGNIISWNIRVEDYTGTSIEGTDAVDIVRVFGRVNGKRHTINTVVREGKNIGKKNATTPRTQAIKEAKAMVKAKAKEGYRSLIELGGILLEGQDKPYIAYIKDGLNAMEYNIFLETNVPKLRLDENNFSKPMLASKYKGKMVLPCIVQRKINGVRALISYREKPNAGLFDDGKEVIITSREGLVYRIAHIEQWFLANMYDNKDNHDIVFDGEIYIPNQEVTTIGGSAKNPTNPYHNQLKFICYDLAIPELNNYDRDVLRYKLFTKYHIVADFHRTGLGSSVVVALGSIHCHSQEDILMYTDAYIKEGFEGAILRDPNAEYGFGSRKIIMQKSKKFFDSEFELVDIIPTEKDVDKNGKPTCLFVCKNDTTDATFNVTPYGYTKEMKAGMLIHKEAYIGKQITVKYYERTKNGLPFHANGNIRDYE
jgi:hypothetical protein